MDIKFIYIHNKLVEFIWPAEVSTEILECLIQASAYLEKEYGEGIKEIRKGYHSLSVRTHVEISEPDCRDIVAEFKSILKPAQKRKSKRWHLPVSYGGKFGKDLSALAKKHKISEKEVVSRHASVDYTLHFYGFIPGFMYLGGLDPYLSTPRKERPDRLILAGTVAIGGQQTGIYPTDSPGGWYAIGRCPVLFFDINKQPPLPFEVGDRIKFSHIDENEFMKIKSLVDQGNYQLIYD